MNAAPDIKEVCDGHYYICHHPDGVISVQACTRNSEAIHNGLIPSSYRIQSIGVKYLPEVVSHQINNIAGSRSHVIHFVNRGVLRFAYQLNGALLSLEAENLACEISERDEVLFYCSNV